MKIFLVKDKRSRLLTYLLLFAIFVVYALTFVNLNYNSAYIDEAGHIQLGYLRFKNEMEGWNPDSWFFGYYLPSSAFFYFGDIIFNSFLGARAFNIILSIFTSIILYKIFRIFVTKNLALFFLLLFCFQQPIVFVSIHSTYDQGSFFIFCLGLLSLIKLLRDPEDGNAILSGIFISALFFLAAIYKYTALIIVLPVIFSLIFHSKRAVFLKTIPIPFLFFSSIFLILHPDVLNVGQEIVEKISNRNIVTNMSIIHMGAFLVVDILLVPILLFAIFRKFFANQSQTQKKLFYQNLSIVSIIFCLIFVIPAYHLYTGIFTSYNKQMIFPIFGSVLLMVFFSEKIQALKESTFTKNLLALCLASFGIFSFVLNFNLYKINGRLWPNTSKTEDYLFRNIQSNDTILAEGVNIFRIQTSDGRYIRWYQFTDIFDYQSKNSSYEDLPKRLQDEGFSYIVVLGGYYSPEVSFATIGSISSSGNYKRVFLDSEKTVEYSKKLFDFHFKTRRVDLEIWRKI